MSVNNYDIEKLKMEQINNSSFLQRKFLHWQNDDYFLYQIDSHLTSTFYLIKSTSWDKRIKNLLQFMCLN